MGGIVSSVYLCIWYLCICVLASCIVCVLVSQCVLLWESAWVALSPQLVHLAECHTAAHAPTREQALSLVENFDQSQAACPDGHRDNRETETCMEWCGYVVYSLGDVKGLEVGWEKLFQGGSDPRPKYGRGLTGVKIEK